MSWSRAMRTAMMVAERDGAVRLGATRRRNTLEALVRMGLLERPRDGKTYFLPKPAKAGAR